MKIRKNDYVVVVAGEDKGKSGKVLMVDPKRNRVIVEGVNFIKRHTKKRSAQDQGGILEREASIDVSNVRLLYENEPTKVGYRRLADGKKARVAKRTGEVIE